MIKPVFKETANMVEQVFGSIGCCDSKKLSKGQHKSLERNVRIVSNVIADKILPILYDPKLIGNQQEQKAAAAKIKTIVGSAITEINAGESQTKQSSDHASTPTVGVQQVQAGHTEHSKQAHKTGGGRNKTRRNKRTRKCRY